MSDDRTSSERIATSIAGSGFILQTRIYDDLRAHPQWEVIGSEYPYVDPSDRDQFLDMAARRSFPNGLVIAGVECKKTNKETYSFLVPGRSADKVTAATILETRRVLDSSGRVFTCLARCHFGPESFEAEFCDVSTDTRGNRRLLEVDARLVAQSLDAMARVEQDRLNAAPQVTPGQQARRVYIPIIVTNGQLNVVRYLTDWVSRITGELEKPAEVTTVEWVRFTKNLSARLGPQLGRRTVFVVSAQALPKFLSQVELWDSNEDAPTVFSPQIVLGR